MRRVHTFVKGFAAIALAMVAATALAASAPAKMEHGMLVGPTGMTLYTFAKDHAGSGKSVCNGGCAKHWPPFKAAAGAKPLGKFTIITRNNGAKQWAYKGKPLYYFDKDHKPGDKKGNGFKHAWRIVG